MLIETLIYNRLQSTVGTLVGQTGGFSSGWSSGFADYTPGRIYPVMSKENSELPMIVFAITGRDTELLLSGPSDLTTYNLSVDTITEYVDDALNIGSEIITAFHGWRDTSNGIYVGSLTGEANDLQELGYKSQLTFNIMAKV